MNQHVIRIEDLSERRLTRRLLKRLGVRVLHDSGAHLMVIDLQGDTERLAERLPAGACLLAPGDVPAALAPETGTHDTLFARAFALRQSATFRDRKAAQSPGDSPEERHIFSAPCMEED